MDLLWSQIGAVESGLVQSLNEVGRWGQLKAGVTITKGETMFPRIEEPETI
jgi:methionyl-tRNA synthetase